MYFENSVRIKEVSLYRLAFVSKYKYLRTPERTVLLLGFIGREFFYDSEQLKQKTKRDIKIK